MPRKQKKAQAPSSKCICKQACCMYLLRCDNCFRGVHLHCAKVSKEVADQLEGYVCATCKTAGVTDAAVAAARSENGKPGAVVFISKCVRHEDGAQPLKRSVRPPAAFPAEKIKMRERCDECHHKCNNLEIECERCGVEYHYPCVDMTQAKAEKIDEWFCGRCTANDPTLQVTLRLELKSRDKRIAELEHKLSDKAREAAEIVSLKRRIAELESAQRNGRNVGGQQALTTERNAEKQDEPGTSRDTVGVPSAGTRITAEARPEPVPITNTDEHLRLKLKDVVGEKNLDVRDLSGNASQKINDWMSRLPPDACEELKKWTAGSPFGIFNDQKVLSTAGGQGVVHLVELQRRFAVKKVKLARKQVQNLVYLIREGKYSYGLAHKNLLSTLYRCIDGDNAYLVSPLMEAGDIADIMGRLKRCLTEEEAAYVIREALDALIYLHSKNVAHRDMKPQNVLSNLDGEIRVADLGLCGDTTKPRVTGVGTPEYMSPEQATARQKGVQVGYMHDAKVDCWSVGVTLFELVTEQFPVQAGNLNDVSARKGPNYALNFPLTDGIDDETYEGIFVPVMEKVVESFQPSAIVLQCGADSLTDDRLGCFNLTPKGHGKCVEYLKKFSLPMLLLGGGGYTIRNVARCWTHEIAVALDTDISNELPYNDFFSYYGPDYKLHIKPSNMANVNTREELDEVKEKIFEALRNIPHAPGVQIQERAADAMDLDELEKAAADGADPDKRLPDAIADKIVEDQGELYDGEKEGGDQRNETSQKRPAASSLSRAAETDTKKSKMVQLRRSKRLSPADCAFD